MRQRKLYEIHLPELVQSTRHSKMLRSSFHRLPWVLVWTSETSELGILYVFFNVSLPVLIHEDYHFITR